MTVNVTVPRTLKFHATLPILRSSRSEVFRKKGVPKNFGKFTGVFL